MNEQDRQVYEFTTRLKFEELTQRRLTDLRKWFDESLKIRDEFASENTYKLSDLLITLNIGILAAVSFLLSNSDSLSDISKLLSISLVIPVINVLLEINYRKKVIEVNREGYSKRATLFSRVGREDIPSLFTSEHRTPQDFQSDYEEFNEKFDKEINEIAEWVEKEGLKINQLRKWSLTLLPILVASLSLIILIESGLPELLLNFVSRIYLSGC